IKRIAWPLGVVILPKSVLVGFRLGAFHPCRLSRFCAFTRRLITRRFGSVILRNRLRFTVASVKPRTPSTRNGNDRFWKLVGGTFAGSFSNPASVLNHRSSVGLDNAMSSRLP